MSNSKELLHHLLIEPLGHHHDNECGMILHLTSESRQFDLGHHKNINAFWFPRQPLLIEIEQNGDWDFVD
jgi:hypothetical protein